MPLCSLSHLVPSCASWRPSLQGVECQQCKGFYEALESWGTATGQQQVRLACGHVQQQGAVHWWGWLAGCIDRGLLINNSSLHGCQGSILTSQHATEPPASTSACQHRCSTAPGAGAAAAGGLAPPLPVAAACHAGGVLEHGASGSGWAGGLRASALRPLWAGSLWAGHPGQHHWPLLPSPFAWCRFALLQDITQEPPPPQEQPQHDEALSPPPQQQQQAQAPVQEVLVWKAPTTAGEEYGGEGGQEQWRQGSEDDPWH